MAQSVQRTESSREKTSQKHPAHWGSMCKTKAIFTDLYLVYVYFIELSSFNKIGTHITFIGYMGTLVYVYSSLSKKSTLIIRGSL